MPLSSQEDKSSKLPSDVSKSLQKLIKIACAQCHGPCGHLRTLSSSSSPDDDDRSLYSFLDQEQGVILEIIQSRALMMMKAKKVEPRDQLVFSGSPPAPGRVHGTSAEKTPDNGEEERGEAEDAQETESDAFFTVKSFLSCCSSSSTAGRPSALEFRESWALEGFRHCRGWPFGLYHKALVLPPLPSSPADSWMWHKRNLARQ